VEVSQYIYIYIYIHTYQDISGTSGIIMTCQVGTFFWLPEREGSLGGISDGWEIWWGSDRPTTSHGPCQGHQTDVPRDLCSKKRAGAGVLVGKFI